MTTSLAQSKLLPQLLNRSACSLYLILSLDFSFTCLFIRKVLFLLMGFLEGHCFLGLGGFGLWVLEDVGFYDMGLS